MVLDGYDILGGIALPQKGISLSGSSTTSNAKPSASVFNGDDDVEQLLGCHSCSTLEPLPRLHGGTTHVFNVNLITHNIYNWIFCVWINSAERWRHPSEERGDKLNTC